MLVQHPSLIWEYNSRWTDGSDKQEIKLLPKFLVSYDYGITKLGHTASFQEMYSQKVYSTVQSPLISRNKVLLTNMGILHTARVQIKFCYIFGRSLLGLH